MFVRVSSRFFLTWLALSTLPANCAWSAEASLRIPASTAYISPDPEGARVSSRTGIIHWNDPQVAIEWFGAFHQTGSIDARLACTYPSNQVSRLRLTVDGQSQEASVTGADTNQVIVPFGTFQLASTGYHRFSLQATIGTPPPLPQVDALMLEGKPIRNAHFNLKPRRNAASVHLSYPSPTNVNVAAFYCEMTGVLDPVNTYYMACGWHRGYFGMQVNSATERRIIFSVWDSGKEAVDRNKVDDENRVKLLGKGEEVNASDFGNEGTGGHSHLKYRWETAETQRFLVTAQPTNGTYTVYSGYYFHPNKQQWMLISSWRAPKDGKWLRGLYSFSENFGGSTGHLPRRAFYGNQWIRTESGEWREITTASFSHDPTGKSDRLRAAQVLLFRNSALETSPCRASSCFHFQRSSRTARTADGGSQRWPHPYPPANTSPTVRKRASLVTSVGKASAFSAGTLSSDSVPWGRRPLTKPLDMSLKSQCLDLLS